MSPSTCPAPGTGRTQGLPAGSWSQLFPSHRAALGAAEPGTAACAQAWCSRARGATYLSKLGRGGQHGPEAEDQVLSLDAMRVVGGLEAQREGHETSAKAASPHLQQGSSKASLQAAWHWPGYQSWQHSTAQLRLSPILSSQSLKGTRTLGKHQEEGVMARGRLTHWSKINGEVAGCHFKQLLHKGTCGERSALAELLSKGGTALPSSRDRLALQLLNHIRDTEPCSDPRVIPPTVQGEAIPPPNWLCIAGPGSPRA